MSHIKTELDLRGAHSEDNVEKNSKILRCKIFERMGDYSQVSSSFEVKRFWGPKKQNGKAWTFAQTPVFGILAQPLLGSVDLGKLTKLLESAFQYVFNGDKVI